MLQLHFRVRKNMNTTLTVCQKEQIWIFVPSNFIYLKNILDNASTRTFYRRKLTDLILFVNIHLKFKLFFPSYFVRSHINEWYQIFFVPNCNCFTIWSPCNIDILPLKYVIIVKIIKFWGCNTKLCYYKAFSDWYKNNHMQANINTLVPIFATALERRASHIRTVRSPDAVASMSGSDGCQTNWSTESPCPLYVI